MNEDVFVVVVVKTKNTVQIYFGRCRYTHEVRFPSEVTTNVQIIDL